MNKTMFVCKTCGAQYTACPACEERHSWRAVADNAKCWQIYMTITQHRQGIISDETAISDMNNIGITASTLPDVKLTPENREYLELLLPYEVEKKKNKNRHETPVVKDLIPVEDETFVEQPKADSTVES